MLNRLKTGLPFNHSTILTLRSSTKGLTIDQKQTFTGGVCGEEHKKGSTLSTTQVKSCQEKDIGQLVLLGFMSPLYTCSLSTSSSMTTLYGNLILEPASRLDAFSAYPNRTRLLSTAPGGTTDTPEVRPTRSSRTSVRPPQISYAHNR